MSVQPSASGGSSGKKKRTLKVKDGSVTLSSSWQCEHIYPGSGPPYYSYVSSNMPTSASKVVEFKYSLPSGAKIKRAKICCKISGGGYSVLNVNGNRFVKDGSVYSATVKLTKKSGTFKAKFNYKASGSKEDTARHSSTKKFTGIYLKIEYYGEKKEKTENSSKPKGIDDSYYTPPQSICLYDKSKKKVYMFDGVAKVQHSLTMDVQEEPDSKKKDQFVNNARNQPDKVTMDILMSDVYKTRKGNSITSYSGKYKKDQLTALKKTKSQRIEEMDNSRSLTAYHVLHKLKEDRKKLIIITPQYVYMDMILTTVTVNQDDNMPFGWEGQLVFQKAFEATKKKNKNSSSKSDGGTSVPSPSVLSTWGVRI